VVTWDNKNATGTYCGEQYFYTTNRAPNAPVDPRCENLTNQYYRDLCRVLQIEPGTRPTTTPFTGNTTVDVLILNNLTDAELIEGCRTNKYLNDLCNNESFWMNRTLQKFPFLGTGREIYDNYIPARAGWKEYYIWLSDMALVRSDQLEELANTTNRLDLKLLAGYKRQDMSLMGYVIMSQELLNFFREANLGTIDPTNPNSPTLREGLYSLRTGITTRGILNRLLGIYVGLNPDKSLFQRYFPQFTNISRNRVNRALLNEHTLRYNRTAPEFENIVPDGEALTRDNSLINYLAGYYHVN